MKNKLKTINDGSLYISWLGFTTKVSLVISSPVFDTVSQAKTQKNSLIFLFPTGINFSMKNVLQKIDQKNLLIAHSLGLSL